MVAQLTLCQTFTVRVFTSIFKMLSFYFIFFIFSPYVIHTTWQNCALCATLSFLRLAVWLSNPEAVDLLFNSMLMKYIIDMCLIRKSLFLTGVWYHQFHKAAKQSYCHSYITSGLHLSISYPSLFFFPLLCLALNQSAVHLPKCLREKSS